MATVLLFAISTGCNQEELFDSSPRERISINTGWRFMKYEEGQADSLIYDVRPEVNDTKDDKQADAMPTEAVSVQASKQVLKPWILPSANDYIKDNNLRHERPLGNPGSTFPFVQSDFDDSVWEEVDLPHDWAINGPFYEGWNTPVGGGMGRLPSPGVAWYRKTLELSQADQGKSIFLNIDGAMSYAMVWFNGQLVGGWPYGYSSFRLDLTPYVNFGGANQLAIRLDNPPNSSRWYPGGGIYRNVWLVKTQPIHVAHWGTFVTTPKVTKSTAEIAMELVVENDGPNSGTIEVSHTIHELALSVEAKGTAVAQLERKKLEIAPGEKTTINASTTIDNPKLWGPPPSQQPNRYAVVTELYQDGKLIDRYQTNFGIRSIELDPEQGVLVNGESVYLQGVNQHHDLGALGAAFNYRAAERQLELLQEVGCNAIRIAHNPPAPELLDLTDQMGFLVIDELYDCWQRKKTPLDFHLIYDDWSEPDLRALIRRDRNHPSVIMWSTGNEVGEQYTGEEGALVARRLRKIANDEDPTRTTTASMNFAQADMPLPKEMEVINLNYQGEGIRDAKEYVHLRKGRITTPPAYPMFHQAHPNKVIISSENAAALSTRGTYIFPVASAMSAPVSDTTGGDPDNMFVSSYELYTAQFGSSADKVFRSLDQHPYVAGGFVWSGWDYIGEPTPYYLARSSYYGLIDLAGFKKDRFYLYQSKWRPELPMAHILPHWNWPDRVGQVTPVHVFTSGDEAELFLNGKSMGRKTKKAFEYRLRWDDIKYSPGELKVVAYKNGQPWAEETIRTTGEAIGIQLTIDRNNIAADGQDLAFVTATIVDQYGSMVPDANHEITFSIEGPGELVATDNGDPTCMVPFPSKTRPAFNGLCLGIVKSDAVNEGNVTITATASDLKSASINLTTGKQ